MNKEQWTTLETELSSAWGRAALQVDGYKLDLVVRRWKPLQYCIVIFVNNQFNGEWLRDDCEIRRRFCYPRTVRLWSGESRKQLLKIPKRRRGTLDPNATGTYYQNVWFSPKTLIRHLKKHNENIEMVKPAVGPVLSEIRSTMP